MTGYNQSLTDRSRSALAVFKHYLNCLGYPQPPHPSMMGVILPHPETSTAGTKVILYYLWLKFYNLALDSSKPLFQQDELSAHKAEWGEIIRKEQ